MMLRVFSFSGFWGVLYMRCSVFLFLFLVFMCTHGPRGDMSNLERS